MRAATLLPLAFLASAPLLPATEGELDALQRRCAEQERQIRQLEIEKQRLEARLRQLESRPESTEPTAAEASEPAPEPAEAAPRPAENRHVVRAGESLARIARRHGTDVATLARLNSLDDPSLIRVGQRLRLPAASTSTSPSADATHVVRPGETLFSIARRHGLSLADIEAANPGVDARKLRVGQELSLGASSPAESPTDTAGEEAEKASPAPTTDETAETGLVHSKPRVRSVRLDEEMTFGDFASRHRMDPAKLNALNGLHLDPSTLLAEGSELYVSAQP